MKNSIVLISLLSTCCFAEQHQIATNDWTASFWKTNRVDGYFVSNNLRFITNVAITTCYTNRFLPVRFEPEIQEVTNIVVLDKYKGTIQVGTNFYHLQTVTNYWTDTKLEKK